jgi:hypothetical protein
VRLAIEGAEHGLADTLFKPYLDLVDDGLESPRTCKRRRPGAAAKLLLP